MRRPLEILVELLKNEDGGPLIEFSVAGMFVVICIPALLDISTLIHAHTQLSAGMRGGAQYATLHPTDSEGITSAVEAASQLANLEVTSSQFCECNNNVVDCTATCGAGIPRKRYTQINAVYPMGDVFNIEELYPNSISKTFTVRTQ